jgi:membrane protein implicated in regulation of membrane protease activity
MSTLISVYIACTIFGVGVTIIDMLGILGDLFQEGDAGGEGGDEGDFGDEGGEDAFDDGGDYGDVDGDAGDEGVDDGDFEVGNEDGDGEYSEEGALEHGEKGSVTSHENYRERHILLRILTTARSLVHFSLGFGPVGWFALATGETAVASVAWSVPVGVVTLVGGRLLRRIQRSELDSQVTTEDLIMERGQVIVSIGKGQLGKVRVVLEGTYADRFARAANPEDSLPAGTPIRVVDVSDECVYVEEE